MHGNGHGDFGVTRLAKTIVTCVAVLLIAAPALVQIAWSLIPVVLVIAVVVVAVRLLWFYTGRW